MKLHIFTILIIGICIASTGLFIDAAAGQERRGSRRPFEQATSPLPAVRKLCYANRLYRLAEIETPVAQIRSQGCEEVTFIHINNGFYLFSGTFIVVGEVTNNE